MEWLYPLGINIVVALILLSMAGIAAVVTYRMQIVPKQQGFSSIKGTQFYSLVVLEWAADFENKKSHSPIPTYFRMCRTTVIWNRRDRVGEGLFGEGKRDETAFNGYASMRGEI